LPLWQVEARSYPMEFFCTDNILISQIRVIRQ
jgi:hypothetical protein